MMKEKLTELLSKSPYLDVLGGLGFYEKASEHLIAHGVVIPVRCKDCVHGESDEGGWYFCHYDGHSWNEGEHFCSDGERETET